MSFEARVEDFLNSKMQIRIIAQSGTITINPRAGDSIPKKAGDQRAFKTN